MRNTFTTVALLLVIPGMSLPAQTEQRVLVGTRVRITMPDTMRISRRPSSAGQLFVIGQLVAMSDSSISVRHEASSADVTVPLSRVQRLEVSAGSRRREAAVIGGLVGLGLGGIFGYAAGDDCSGNEGICFPQGEVAVVSALVGAGLGSLIGVVVGSGERWRDASVPARVNVVPTGARSISISSTLRF